MIQKMSSLWKVKSYSAMIDVGDILVGDIANGAQHSRLELCFTKPSININMEDGIKAKTTNPPVAKTETEIQIDRFV